MEKTINNSKNSKVKHNNFSAVNEIPGFLVQRDAATLELKARTSYRVVNTTEPMSIAKRELSVSSKPLFIQINKRNVCSVESTLLKILGVLREKNTSKNIIILPSSGKDMVDISFFECLKKVYDESNDEQKENIVRNLKSISMEYNCCYIENLTFIMEKVSQLSEKIKENCMFSFTYIIADCKDPVNILQTINLNQKDVSVKNSKVVCYPGYLDDLFFKGISLNKYIEIKNTYQYIKFGLKFNLMNMDALMYQVKCILKNSHGEAVLNNFTHLYIFGQELHNGMKEKILKLLSLLKKIQVVHFDFGIKNAVFHLKDMSELKEFSYSDYNSEHKMNVSFK